LTTAITGYVAGAALDADLAAVCWLLGEGGVPLVVVGRDHQFAEGLRSSIAKLSTHGKATADGVAEVPGGVVVGDALEDVLRFSGSEGLALGASDAVPDAARELGVVLVARGNRIERAHYVRPIERDAAGHIQRRPPALLSARNDDTGRLDHFFWAITDELGTRVSQQPEDFDRAFRRRVRLLSEMVAANIFDQEDLLRHIERSALVEAGGNMTTQQDAPN
jgi:hypothetical protein